MAKSKIQKSQKLRLNENVKYSRKQAAIFILAFGVIGCIFVFNSIAGPPSTSQPFVVKNEVFEDRNIPGGCVSEDDQLDIIGNNGYLAPGQTYTYTTKTPDCDRNDRIIHMVVTWGPKSSRNMPTLELSSIVAANELWAGWGSTYFAAEDHVGKRIVATAKPPTVNVKTSAGSASLCMFSKFNEPKNYTFTIKNTGTVTATNIAFSSTDRNDWPDFYLNNCRTSDADRDGFSDAAEHYKAMWSAG
ncbi:MAG TPA: hypothetical protein VF272_03675, partial [Candidatus Saccharimonadia bacterium]